MVKIRLKMKRKGQDSEWNKWIMLFDSYTQQEGKNDIIKVQKS